MVWGLSAGGHRQPGGNKCRYWSKSLTGTFLAFWARLLRVISSCCGLACAPCPSISCPSPSTITTTYHHHHHTHTAGPTKQPWVGLKTDNELLWRTTPDSLIRSLEQETKGDWLGPGTLLPACLPISQTIADLIG